MFYNLKPIIAKALLSNENITDYLAKTTDGHTVLGSNKLVAGLFPALEFHSVGGSDLKSSDDSVDIREYRYQVTIFTKDSSHYLVENHVDQIFRALGFRCYFDHEMYDNTLDITSRVMLYQVYLNNERFEVMQNQYPLTSEEEAELEQL